MAMTAVIDNKIYPNGAVCDEHFLISQLSMSKFEQNIYIIILKTIEF